MRKLLSAFLVLLSSTGLDAQNVPTTTGLPGDNLNLYLVLDLFKQSNSAEEFEKKLNSPDTKINNLDLNNDGTIDYLKVSDYGKDDYHTIVIQDIVSASETQDVAIIDIQKINGNTAHVQIVGDESLYGKDYIIEPQLENTAQAPAPQPTTTVVNNNYYTYENPAPYVNVWSWPSVNYYWATAYQPWVSPWHWSYYPTWWNVRPRVYYSVYYSYHKGFGWNNYCRRDYVINKPYYTNYYSNRRMVSNTVQVNITKNVYKNNYHHNNGNGNYKNNGTFNGSYNKNGNVKPQNNGNQYPKKNNGNWNGNHNKTPKTIGTVGEQNNNNPQPDKPKWNKNNSGNVGGMNNTSINPYKGNHHHNNGGYNKSNTGEKPNGGFNKGGNGGGKGGQIKTGSKPK